MHGENLEYANPPSVQIIRQHQASFANNNLPFFLLAAIIVCYTAGRPVGRGYTYGSQRLSRSGLNASMHPNLGRHNFIGCTVAVTDDSRSKRVKYYTLSPLPRPPLPPNLFSYPATFNQQHSSMTIP